MKKRENGSFVDALPIPKSGHLSSGICVPCSVAKTQYVVNAMEGDLVTLFSRRTTAAIKVSALVSALSSVVERHMGL